MAKSLPATSAQKTDRKSHLRDYIIACICENVISAEDLIKPGVLGKIGNAITLDIKEVVQDLGKTGGANALRMAVSSLLGLMTK